MTFQDVLEELDKMTVDEQLRLMQALSQRLQQSVEKQQHRLPLVIRWFGF